ncbi:unnamed protein product [Prorocentrum cordatum]|uniref:Uncharacterized protein n=1 Tax=Prorocentrum cordatum TaxID=2364126 RepID=A0ABN9R2I0_9DINO|nr:unnamed protein product [Polarella glacialis]
MGCVAGGFVAGFGVVYTHTSIAADVIACALHSAPAYIAGGLWDHGRGTQAAEHHFLEQRVRDEDPGGIHVNRTSRRFDDERRGIDQCHGGQHHGVGHHVGGQHDDTVQLNGIHHHPDEQYHVDELNRGVEHHTADQHDDNEQYHGVQHRVEVYNGDATFGPLAQVACCVSEWGTIQRGTSPLPATAPTLGSLGPRLDFALDVVLGATRLLRSILLRGPLLCAERLGVWAPAGAGPSCFDPAWPATSRRSSSAPWSRAAPCRRAPIEAAALGARACDVHVQLLRCKTGSVCAAAARAPECATGAGAAWAAVTVGTAWWHPAFPDDEYVTDHGRAKRGRTDPATARQAAALGVPLLEEDDGALGPVPKDPTSGRPAQPANLEWWDAVDYDAMEQHATAILLASAEKAFKFFDRAHVRPEAASAEEAAPSIFERVPRAAEEAAPSIVERVPRPTEEAAPSIFERIPRQGGGAGAGRGDEALHRLASPSDVALQFKHAAGAGIRDERTWRRLSANAVRALRHLKIAEVATVLDSCARASWRDDYLLCGLAEAFRCGAELRRGTVREYSLCCQSLRRLGFCPWTGTVRPIVRELRWRLKFHYWRPIDVVSVLRFASDFKLHRLPQVPSARALCRELQASAERMVGDMRHL